MMVQRTDGVRRRRAVIAAAALALLTGSLLATTFPDPAAAAPVGCTDAFYFATANTITQRSADGTLTPVTTSIDPWTIALHPLDGQLYAFPNSTSIGNHLFVIEADGTSTDLGAVTGMPGGALYSLGGFDDSGTLWTASTTTLYAVDVAALSATSIPLSGGVLADFAYIDGALYGQGGTSFAPLLATVDRVTGAVTTVSVPGMINATSFLTVGGHLYISQGTGISEVLGYDTPTPTLLPVATGLPSVPRDGASCPTGPSPFLNASDDDFTATPLDAAGGTAGGLFGNDTRNGAAVVAIDVTATVIADGGLVGVVIAADGVLSVPPGATPGTYFVDYRLCAVAIPTLCDTAVATVVVVAPAPSTQPELARSGVDVAPLLIAGVVMVGAGVWLSRRRRQSESEAY